MLVAVPILMESDGEYVDLDEFLMGLTELLRRLYPHKIQFKAPVIRTWCWEKYWLLNNDVIWTEGIVKTHRWLRW